MKKLFAFLGILAASVILGFVVLSDSIKAQDASCINQCKSEYSDCLAQANEYSDEEKQSQTEQCKADLDSCNNNCESDSE
jgi:hypothetical protein